MRPGALKIDQRCRFRVWAPFRDHVALKFYGDSSHAITMEKDERGYWSLTLDSVSPGTRYRFVLDQETERPDPASNCQPDGVHGHSEVIDHNLFSWDDSGWTGIPLSDMLIYEIHVGTFTHKGTFEAIIPRLQELKSLGVNVIQLMPVAQFPGTRNWGYDGVYPYAVQYSYGGPEGLKTLVNACHQQDIAVSLDVVYNHLGPEGNYLRDFGPYFTDRYRTPWGPAVNFDGAYSDEVRNYFIENARYWFCEYHIDALRLDAIHAIYDQSARPFLRELTEETDKLSESLGRRLYLFPESNLNDPGILRSREQHGIGLHAQWSDDFHHAIHALLTGERDGYYADFGTLADVEKAMREAFVQTGEYSRYRKRRHGCPAGDRPGEQFIVYLQNHDEVGNRMNGERLSHLISFEARKLATAVLFLAPNIPLLFMGEEYAEDSPFLYFVEHGDPALIEAVRKGRKEEFAAFDWDGEPPDPQSPATFSRSELQWESRNEGRHGILLAYYQQLAELRRRLIPLNRPDNNRIEIHSREHKGVLEVRRWQEDQQVYAVCSFNENQISCTLTLPAVRWEKVLDSANDKWKGPGETLPGSLRGETEVRIPPHSVGIYWNSTDDEAELLIG